MKTIDVQDELAAGFEVGPLPPMGADGGLSALEPARAPDPPPRLCEQGPCIHYHRFEILMDAAKPVADGVDEDGHARGQATEVREHSEIHHYCYPDSGIETVLGSLPVVQCNRWTPITKGMVAAASRKQREFLKSKAGKAYRAELGQWQERQDALVAEENETIAAARQALEEAARARGEGQPG